MHSLRGKNDFLRPCEGLVLLTQEIERLVIKGKPVMYHLNCRRFDGRNSTPFGSQDLENRAAKLMDESKTSINQT